MMQGVRQGGRVDWAKDWLKILMKTPASLSVQSFSTSLGTPWGPAALLRS